MLNVIPKSLFLMLAREIFDKVILPLIQEYVSKTPNKIDDAGVKLLEEVVEYVTNKLNGKV